MHREIKYPRVKLIKINESLGSFSEVLTFCLFLNRDFNCPFLNIDFNFLFLNTDFNCLFLNRDFNSLFLNIDFNCLFLNRDFNGLFLNTDFNRLFHNIDFNYQTVSLIKNFNHACFAMCCGIPKIAGSHYF